MSTSSQQQQSDRQPEQRSVKCHLPECESVGRPWTFQKGYCSTEHWHRHKGRKALSDVRRSHVRCFTCFATLKDIEPPKPDFEFLERGVELTYNAEDDYLEWVQYRQKHTQRAACGYQSLRPEATIGEKDLRHKTVTGAVCGECGNVAHYEHIPFLADGHRTAAHAVAYLTAEDDDEFDTELLHRRYAATGDIELAAGAAILAR